MTSELKILKGEVLSNQKIKIPYWQLKNVFGEIVANSKTLKPINDNPTENPEKQFYPAELMTNNRPENTVKWLNVPNKDKSNTSYAFRWETMGIRRFYEKEKSLCNLI